jgi:prevent-host-death family protein
LCGNVATQSIFRYSKSFISVVAAMKTVSSREFNNDVAGAKRAAATEPLFITDRGEPAFVLLSIEKFRELTRSGKSALDALVELGAQFPNGELNFEWEPERIRGAPRAAELDV